MPEYEDDERIKTFYNKKIKELNIKMSKSGYIDI